MAIVSSSSRSGLLAVALVVPRQVHPRALVQGVRLVPGESVLAGDGQGLVEGRLGLSSNSAPRAATDAARQRQRPGGAAPVLVLRQMRRALAPVPPRRSVQASPPRWPARAPRSDGNRGPAPRRCSLDAEGASCRYSSARVVAHRSGSRARPSRREIPATFVGTPTRASASRASRSSSAASQSPDAIRSELTAKESSLRPRRVSVASSISPAMIWACPRKPQSMRLRDAGRKRPAAWLSSLCSQRLASPGSTGVNADHCR